jgi:hypothetical protein
MPAATPGAVELHAAGGVSARRRPSRTPDRRFYTGMALGVLIAVIIGFAPTYYLRSRFTSSPLPAFLHVHGLLFSSWVVFLLLQAGLVAAGRTALHRRIGWLGAALALAMVPVGVVSGILSMRAQVDAGNVAPALAFLTTPVLSMVVFSILAGAGIALRRQPEHHKRLMLLATISLLDAALARWPIELLRTSTWAFYVAADLFIAVAMIYDLATRGRVHPVHLWGGALIVAGQALRTPLGQTDAWHAIARVLLGA